MHRRLARSMLVLCLAAAPGLPALAAGDPAKAARFYENGLTRYNQDDIAGAVIQLKNALQQDGRMLAAHVLLAKALMKIGQLPPAEVAFKEAISLGVDIGEVAVPLGQLYLALGRPQEVLDRLPSSGLQPEVQAEVLRLRASAFAEKEALTEALQSLDVAKRLGPSLISPLLTEVEILVQAGRLAPARDVAELAVVKSPATPGAWNARGSVLHASGELEAALADYSKAVSLDSAYVEPLVARAAIYTDLKRDAEAWRDLGALKALDAQEPRAAFLRAVLYERAGDRKSMAASFGEVQQLISRLPLEWLAGRQQLLMLGALSNQALGNLEKSASLLEVILRRYPRNFDARRLLASVQLDQSDPARALETLEPLLRRNPDDAGGLFLAGRANLALKRFEKATAQFERAAELGGSSSAAVNAALGQSRVGAGKTALGLRDLEQAFARQPNDTGVGYMLAVLLMRQGETKRAQELATRMQERRPRDPAILNLQGALKTAVGDLAGARVVLQQALSEDPKLLAARLNLVRLDIATGQFDAAREALDRLQRAHPDNPGVLFEIGRVYDQQLRLKEAAAAYRAAFEKDRSNIHAALALIDVQMRDRQGNEAIKAARELAISHPKDLRVMEVLARSLIAGNDKDAARSVYREMTLIAEFDAAAQVRIGRVALAAGYPDDAAYNAHKALTATPGMAEARLLEGAIAVGRRDWNTAEAIATELRKRPGSEVSGLRLSADIALASGDPGRAAGFSKEVLKRTGKLDDALVLSRMQFFAGHLDEAVRTLESWITKAPKSFALRVALAELLLRSKKWAAAEVQLQKAREINPTSTRVLNFLAIAMGSQGKPEALKVAESAVKLSPADPILADTFGWLLVRTGDVEGGMRHLRDAKLRLPENAEIRYHLAWVLAKTGRREEALSEVEAALRIGEEFEGVEDARNLRTRLISP